MSLVKHNRTTVAKHTRNILKNTHSFCHRVLFNLCVWNIFGYGCTLDSTIIHHWSGHVRHFILFNYNF